MDPKEEAAKREADELVRKQNEEAAKRKTEDDARAKTAKDNEAKDTLTRSELEARIKAERSREREIRLICKRSGLDDKADQYIEDGKTVDEVDTWINGWAGGLREPGEPPRGGAAMKIRNIMADIAQVQSWGLEPAKSIGRQIALWEDILSLARRFPPVAKRPYGLTIDEIQFQIEQLRKQARDLRNKDGDG